MKRRDFLKSTLMLAVFASVSKLVASTESAVWALVGKLGYKEESDKVKLNRFCDNCSFYKKNEGEEAKDGLCSLPAMLNAMKAKEVLVKEKGVCNMWKKIVEKGS